MNINVRNWKVVKFKKRERMSQVSSSERHSLNLNVSGFRPPQGFNRDSKYFQLFFTDTLLFIYRDEYV